MKKIGDSCTLRNAPSGSLLRRVQAVAAVSLSCRQQPWVLPSAVVPGS